LQADKNTSTEITVIFNQLLTQSFQHKAKLGRVQKI
jgi:hypothetical protein